MGRLDIYANMYFYRLLDILAGDFPKLAAVLGEAGFHNLATDYLLACPSRHPSVRNVGDRLADFLKAREPAWHAELARLEWARVDVFDAHDDELLTAAALSQLPPEEFAALPLRPISALRRVEAQFAVDDLWPDADENASADENANADESRTPAEDARTILVWRQDSSVFHRALDPLEARAWTRIDEGDACFGHICDLVVEFVDGDEATLAALHLLQRWVADELLRVG